MGSYRASVRSAPARLTEPVGRCLGVADASLSLSLSLSADPGTGELGSAAPSIAALQGVRVLRAAVRIVHECGYAQMSVARVAARARVSRRTFYELFTDREACFLAACELALAQAGARMGDAYARGLAAGGWSTGVRGALQAMLDLIERDPALGSLLILEALKAGPRVLERRAQVLAQLGATLQREGARAGRGARGLPPLTGEGAVGAAFGVLHTRLAQPGGGGSLRGLLGPLTAVIVLPYLGPAAARRELGRAVAEGRGTRASSSDREPAVLESPAGLAENDGDPLAGLPMRVTYRTLRVLGALAQHPGASNRVVGELAGVHDQGQISKLLARLDGLGLIENGRRTSGVRGSDARRGGGSRRVAGEANAWCLTARGVGVERALRVQGNSGNVNGGSVR